jgi:hypothetical protein
VAAGRNNEIQTIELIFEATKGLQIPSLNGSLSIAIISVSSELFKKFLVTV